MPTQTFHSFGNDDIIEAVHVSEMHEPIQNLERGASFYGGLTSGSNVAYVVSINPPPDSPYSAGMRVSFKAHSQNIAGAPDVTLDVNGIGAKPIRKNGGAALSAGDIKTGQVVTVIYDSSGTGQFHLLAVATSNSLDDLTDAVISSPAPRQLIDYQGSSFRNSLIMPGLQLFGSVPAKILFKRSLNNPSGTYDVGSPPAGKRWMIRSCYAVCPGNVGGVITFTSGFKFSGTYVDITSAVGMSANSAWETQSRYYPILESTDTLTHTASASGLSVFYEILEFSNTSPLKTVRNTSLSVGNNTLYTCPAGKCAQVVSLNGLGYGTWLAASGSWLIYNNLSGSNRTVYYNVCKAGDSPSAPGIGSQSMLGAAQTVASGSSTNLGIYPFHIYGGLQAGDFITINTNSSAATQRAWLTIQEFG